MFYMLSNKINYFSHLVIPRNLALTKSNATLYAGHTYIINCSSDNGYPQPTHAWFINSQLRVGNMVNVQEVINPVSGYNRTTARLMYTAVPGDNGMVIRCNLTHPHTTTSLSVWETLNIYCKYC